MIGSRALIAALWSIALTLALWVYASAWMAIGGGLGCVIGGIILGDRCRGWPCLILLVAVFLGLMANPAWGCRLGLTFSSAVIVTQVLAGLLLSGAWTAAFSTLRWRYPWFRIVEAIALLIVVTSLLAAHRHGHLDRPRWLADWATLGQHDLLSWLTGAGVLAMLLVVVLWCKASSVKVRLSAGSIGLMAVLLGGIAAALFKLPPPPLSPPHPPLPPPRLPDVPPPPPPPQGEVLVVFPEWFMPQGQPPVLYFRDEAALPDRPPLEKSVMAQMYWLIQPKNPAALVNAASTQTLRAKPPFVRAFVTHSILANADPLLANVVYGDSGWDVKTRSEWLHTEQTGELLRIRAEALSDATSPPQKLNNIKHWVEANVPLSEQIATELGERTSIEVLKQKKPASRKQCAELLVALLRSADIPARTAHGYCQPLSGGFQRHLLLTAQHAQTWPEVFAQDAGWTPLLLRPTQVLDEATPPPETDLEDLLAKLAAPEEDIHTPAQPATNQRDPSLAIGCATGALLLFIAGIAHAVWLLCDSAAPRRALNLFLRALRLANVERRFGESWAAFAQRVRSLNRPLGSGLLLLLATLNSKPNVGRRMSLVMIAYMPWFAVPWFLLQRLRSQPSTIPHP